MGQTGRKDGNTRREVRWDGDARIAHDGLDADHQFSQVDGGGVDRAREDDVDDLSEISADNLAGKDLDIHGVDSQGQGVLDEQRLGWRSLEPLGIFTVKVLAT